MRLKICLDAGHCGKYNRSPANRYFYESEMAWKLHLLLKKHLEGYGILVSTTRKTIEDNLGVYERGIVSKGCDLLISIHSNAVGSRTNEVVDYPVAYVLLNGTSSDIGFKLVKTIEQVMGTRQHGKCATRKGGNGEYYGVLRGANDVGTPGIILEHSFHTNTAATNWLLDNANLEKLAKAEAECIARHYGLQTNQSAMVTLPYRVKVSVSDLNIRKGPGTDYDTVGKYLEKGVFTIVGEAEGKGASKWGLLKAYEAKRNGWISLDYTKKI